MSDFFFLCEVAHAVPGARALMAWSRITQEALMFTRHLAAAFVVLAIAGSDSRAAEVAWLPSAVGALAPSGFQSAWPVVSHEAPVLNEHSGSGSLSENSWDFANPNSIPGFGTLPPNHGTRSILPHFSGQ